MNQHGWIWLLWLLSQTWITFHIWMPKCERLAPTEKLFVRPMYCSLLIDQSLGLNRRRDGDVEVKTEDLELDRSVLSPLSLFFSFLAGVVTSKF